MYISSDRPWTQHLGRGLASAQGRGMDITALVLLATPQLTQPRGHWPSCPPGHTLGTSSPSPFLLGSSQPLLPSLELLGVVTQGQQ